GAEAERDERIDHLARGGAEPEKLGEDEEVDRDAEECEAGDEKAGDGTGAEGEAKTIGEALGGGLGGPHVGAYRDVHADITGRAGQDGADGEAYGLRQTEQIGKQEEDEHADDADRGVLAREIGLGPLLDGG